MALVNTQQPNSPSAFLLQTKVIQAVKMGFASARTFAKLPEHMAAIAIIIGSAAVCSRFLGSLEFDSLARPSIVVSALLCFILSLFLRLKPCRKK